MLCAPIQCCCKGPWTIGPGETQPLTLDWSRWLNSSAMGGFTLNAVSSASLVDMTAHPPQPADPDDIRIVSGLGDDAEPDNAEAKGLVNLLPAYAATQIMIAVAEDVRVGSQYRLNLAVTARDCDGRRATMRDCVMIVVAEC
jgi:hypothetical protein